MNLLRCAFRLPIGIAIFSTLAAGARPAAADVTKAQCIDANAKGQDLRRDGKLSAAREQLRACVSPSCPALVREDCARRLDEVEAAQPTLVFDARDTSGRDRSAVSVTVDGQPWTEKLDGTALPVDPGEHAFTFTVPDQPPVTLTLVVKEGQKERREPLALGTPPPTATALATGGETPAASVPSASPPHAASRGLGTRKILGVAAAGAGLAGIAIGSVFGGRTFSEASQQKSDCASPTSCTHHTQAVADHASATTDGAISMVGFIAGGVLLAGGAALFFAPTRTSEPPAATAIVVSPAVAPGAGFLSVSGRF
jgi:hypothetical protein